MSWAWSDDDDEGDDRHDGEDDDAQAAPLAEQKALEELGRTPAG